MKRIFVFAALIFSPFLYGQKVFPPMAEKNWSLSSTTSGFTPDIIYTSEKEAVVPVKFSNKEFAVVKINNDGKEVWKTNVDGVIAALSKKNEKVFAFIKDFSKKDMILKLIVLNAGDGKKLGESVVYEDKDGNHIYEVDTYNIKDNLSYLAIRKTEAERSLSFGDNGNSLKTKELYFLTFDNDGKKIKDIKVLLSPEALYAGAELNNDNDLFVGYLLDDKFSISKYNSEGKQLLTLDANVPFDHKRKIYPVLSVDRLNGQNIWATIVYTNKKDKFRKLFGFDFSTKKVLASAEEELNKDLGKEIEMTEVKEAVKASFKALDVLRPADIIAHGENIITLERAIYTSSLGTKGSSIRYHADGFYVNFYDRQLKKIKTIGLDKSLESFLVIGLSLGYKIDGEKLYFFSPANGKKLLSVVNHLTVINLKEMKFEDVMLLEKGSLKKDVPVESAATLWFGNTAIVSYVIPQGPGN